MYINDLPRPAEHLHEVKCLSQALISAIENERDSLLEARRRSEMGPYYGAHDFRLMAQDNDFLTIADRNLNDGTSTCMCEGKWSYAELGIQYRAGYISQVLYQAEADLSHEDFLDFVREFVHGEDIHAEDQF